MKAFFKTLFGDPATIAVVTVVMALEVALSMHHLVAAAVLAVPFTVLLGVAWLAKT
jgi:hypothetical protein